MRRTTIAAAAAAAVIAGGALAVPALASGSDPTPTASASSAPVTRPDRHPAAGAATTSWPRTRRSRTALVTRLDGWQTFADAHPAVVAELKKVAALPADQRKAELKTWAKAHPADAKAWHEFRQQIRDDRKERREAAPGHGASARHQQSTQADVARSARKRVARRA